MQAGLMVGMQVSPMACTRATSDRQGGCNKLAHRNTVPRLASHQTHVATRLPAQAASVATASR